MSAIVFDGGQPRMTPAGPDFIYLTVVVSEICIQVSDNPPWRFVSEPLIRRALAVE
jgi:hypothetical protein